MFRVKSVVHAEGLISDNYVNITPTNAIINRRAYEVIDSEGAEPSTSKNLVSKTYAGLNYLKVPKMEKL